jgi:hypothetical protein
MFTYLSRVKQIFYTLKSGNQEIRLANSHAITQCRGVKTAGISTEMRMWRELV